MTWRRPRATWTPRCRPMRRARPRPRGTRCAAPRPRARPPSAPPPARPPPARPAPPRTRAWRTRPRALPIRAATARRPPTGCGRRWRSSTPRPRRRRLWGPSTARSRRTRRSARRPPRCGGAGAALCASAGTPPARARRARPAAGSRRSWHPLSPCTHAHTHCFLPCWPQITHTHTHTHCTQALGPVYALLDQLDTLQGGGEGGVRAQISEATAPLDSVVDRVRARARRMRRRRRQGSGRCRRRLLPGEGRPRQCRPGVTHPKRTRVITHTRAQVAAANDVVDRLQAAYAPLVAKYQGYAYTVGREFILCHEFKLLFARVAVPACVRRRCGGGCRAPLARPQAAWARGRRGRGSAKPHARAPRAARRPARRA